MLKITEIKIDNAKSGIVTDSKHPRISFALASDRNNCELAVYRIKVYGGGKVWDSGDRFDKKQISILCECELLPFTHYEVKINVNDNFGEEACKSAEFCTGRLGTPWNAKWITDKNVSMPEKSSPVPLLFRKRFKLKESPIKATLCVTSLGIYDLSINGEKLGERYFAPGFTSYLNQIQYQCYEVQNLIENENQIVVRVGAGWAVGAFTITRKNKTYADTQGLLLELYVKYADGTSEIIGTDENWEVSTAGKMRFADWYDGEVYDATVDEDSISYKPADIAVLKSEPKIIAEYGQPVRLQEELEPVSCHIAPSGEIIYDFGQNFAGVICAEIEGKRGQKITFRHSEVLLDGELFVRSLRSAKAMAEYVCIDGKQQYSPTMTFMGFRYAGVSGIDRNKIKLRAYVLHSDLESTGTFSCSNELINGLQRNIVWSARSNFIDIPTDCPQRDERMGWTGDISVFAKTACFNFDMSRFLDKWLKDVKAEQIENGAIPFSVPHAGDSWKVRPTSCWGDACITVPWAEYLARGDIELLREQYPVMKRFLGAAKHWAEFLSIGKHHRRIWGFLPWQFGDWCSPDGDFMTWILRGKWVATPYFANSCRIVSEVALLLGEEAEAEYYKKLCTEVCTAYFKILARKGGKLKRQFQTAYVLPLHFCMTDGKRSRLLALELKALVEKAGYHPRTGFPGTPYLLFALADNGEKETAFKLLLQESCPSWLYSVKSGGTTIWERWDALRPDGTVNLGKHSNNKNAGMVSFNHYANGAVGDFLYRRVAGIEPISGGYKSFRIAPMIGGSLTYANASYKSPYGNIESGWEIRNGEFVLNISVPVSTTCTVVLPSGETKTVNSGSYLFREACDCASNGGKI